MNDIIKSLRDTAKPLTEYERIQMADSLEKSIKILEWSFDLYAAFSVSATNDQQREALAEYASASNAAHK